MDKVNWVQILDKIVCISHSVYTLGKHINPIILPLAMDKYLVRLGSLTLVWQPVLEKKNSEFKPIEHCF